MNQILPDSSSLKNYGITKSFKAGDEIVSENAPVHSIPILMKRKETCVPSEGPQEQPPLLLAERIVKLRQSG